jgi:hypothetical protein
MSPDRDRHCSHGREASPPAAASPSPLLRRWFAANATLAGLLALAWLLLRSGPRPSRLAYPCQRAALSTAMLAFGAPLIGLVVAARRHLAAGLRSPAGVVAVVLLVVLGLAGVGYLVGVDAADAPVIVPPREYRAQLFHAVGCPQDPVGDRFPGLDGLLQLMGTQGLKIYRSATVTPLSGPDGIVGVDDVVLLKINYQWPERGGTNTDLLRGLIRVLVDHPDGFAGEVVVCENTQFADPEGFDRDLNNAQDPGLSPRDVVDHFAGLGHQVSITDWTALRFTAVSEYSQGDMADGYVVYPNDPQVGGRISYPKFETAHGSYVSLRDGIWDPATGYDRERLTVINLPVLKSHHATYGATACVKHYMGVVSGELDTNSHNAIRYGLLGAVMGEVRPPDLNILDAVWVNANPFDGPWTSYGGATRRDELVAGVDPVAVDIWSVTNILIPAFLDNGYSPPWPHPEATPDDPTSDFRVYLDHSMSELLEAGYDATNDLASIDVVTVDLSLAVFADGFESGDTAAWSGTVP